MNRRLPIYLLLDCSASMTGEAMEAVHQGIKALMGDLRNDPQAIETAYISVITFNSTAQQICPLKELGLFKEPELKTGGSSALGEAMKILDFCLGKEISKESPGKNDWKPIVFIMSDGHTTDIWKPFSGKVKERCEIICCAAGYEANLSLLKDITKNIVELNNLQPDTFRSFFKWTSVRVK